MGLHTKIEWCDSTLNLQMGCDGCELWNPKAGVKRCYAGTLTERYAGRPGWPTAFEQPRIFPERLKEALRWPDLIGKDRPDNPWLNGYPRVIFLNDMGDTFTESLDLEWMMPFVPEMATSRHVYIILTKRPGRMVQFWTRWCLRNGPLERVPADDIPPNFWLLTSVTGSENVGRIRELLKLRALGARVLGVSYEPAWSAVDFRPFLGYARALGVQDGMVQVGGAEGYLDWLIAGGESGAGARPSHPDWFRAARDACQAAGIAYFHKQNGEWTWDKPGRYADWGVITRDGKFFRHTTAWNGKTGQDAENGEVYVYRPHGGKKAAGALLDGREWRQLPEVPHAT